MKQAVKISENAVGNTTEWFDEWELVEN